MVMLLLPRVLGTPALCHGDPPTSAATHFGGVMVLGRRVPSGDRDTRAWPPQPRAAGADTSTSVVGIFNSWLHRLACGECPSPTLSCLRLPPPAPTTPRSRIGPSRAVWNPVGLRGTWWDRMGPGGTEWDLVGHDGT